MVDFYIKKGDLLPVLRVELNDYNDNDDMENDWDDSYDDSMDGDHDSAMESAGWGTDEDYGHYGDDIDAFHDYYGGE